MSAFKKFLPMFDRVLVQRFAAETKTKGGVLIPEKAQSKVLSAKVVAIGTGGRNEKGDTVPPQVKVGDKVLLPEFGGTKVVIDDEELHLFRESDILGKFESS
ncbi:hypothetical protein LSH36_606g01063 [Paralvinella palmiformis]|uniref:10 kDa heat shock protein, mitochondrial n=1 Tax=Paralvinella palmiformis TaxID=53620 RepID=A0AAD9MV03_9ANNE|nr:hypothetical protein LSH36_606g01063 [Paralvinella palmiformis]